MENLGEAFKEIAQAVNSMRDEVAKIVTMADNLQVSSNEIRVVCCR